MLRKIVSIKRVGRFLDYTAAGDVELKRYSLVFAENGRGKTTLCAILRSLQSGNSALILGRTTLGAGGEPEIKVLLDGGMASFANKAWSTSVADIAVFDSTFVSENIHSGDAVGLDHKRKLYSVIIGKKGVDLARKIEELDAESRAKSVEVRGKRSAVEALAPKGMSVEVFARLQPDPDVQAKIQAKEGELKAAEALEEIRNHAILFELSLPEIPARFNAVLGTTVESIAADAERRVAEQIEVHLMGDSGEGWLSEGLGYVIDNKCPFCGQNLDTAAAMMAAYRAYFGEAYENLRTQITALRQEVVDGLGDRKIAGIEKVLDQNAGCVKFWADFCQFAAPMFEVGEGGIEQSLRDLREAALSLLTAKAAKPLEPVVADLPYTANEAVFATMRTKVDSYNQAVRAANGVLETKKAAAMAADLVSLRAALARLRAVETRHNPESQTVCSGYEATVAQKKVIEDEKERVKRELDDYSKQVMGDYELGINGLLDDIDAGFRITETKHAYPGGVASCAYQLLINDTPVDLGDAATPLDRPSFRNTLSSGDKSTLGLAFFLTLLAQDAGKAAKIVVFDDPFNSQDSFRKNWTAQKIKECGAQCAQVIVLSHDERFLGLIWERLAHLPSERKCLRFARVGIRDTTFSAWDIEGATQAQFLSDRQALVDYHNGARGQPCDVVRRIRPVLEPCFRNSHPGHFTQDDSLGDIVGKIRQAGPTHPLFSILDDLESINAYTIPYAHGQSTTQTATIDDGELHAFVKKALRLVGGC